ncbi:MAG: CoB--CoM heterodisulfide reductase iron-sulfur subunit B family protein [Thermoleophilia bacterium]
MLLFPGCLIFTHYQAYELSARAVLERLGIELVDMDEFSCCGSSIVPSFSDKWINLPAYNLALAESKGLDILTLCGSCTRTLKQAQAMLAEDGKLLAQVNGKLAEFGLNYSGTVKVRHILEVLSAKMEEVAAAVTGRLDLNVALSHPCNVIRPSALMQFDNPWKPRKMREIAGLTGATVVDYDMEYECCGSTLMMSDEPAALEAAQAKLGSAISAGARFLIVSCGNCYLLLQGMQDKVRKTSPEISLPLMFLPQLLGLSFGIPAHELGLKPEILEEVFEK